MHDLENDRWLLGDMIDHVGIYGSGVAEGLSAFNVGLVVIVWHWAQMVHVVEILSCGEMERLISHDQYHDCWWSGDTRGQGISSHVLS